MHHLISCRHYWMGRRCFEKSKCIRWKIRTYMCIRWICCSCCISTYCSCCISTYCPIGRLASFCWPSSLLRQSCFFLILVCLGWRHSCCCCLHVCHTGDVQADVDPRVRDNPNRQNRRGHRRHLEDSYCALQSHSLAFSVSLGQFSSCHSLAFLLSFGQMQLQ